MFEVFQVFKGFFPSFPKIFEDVNSFEALNK